MLCSSNRILCLDNVTHCECSLLKGHPKMHFNLTELHVWISVTLLIANVSTILFLILITLLLSERRFHVRVGALILNYILTEFLLVSIVIPLNLIVGYRAQLGHPNPLNCRAYRLVTYALRAAVNWGAFLLAINRFIAIYLPHQYIAWTPPWVVTLKIVLGWFIGIGIALPEYFPSTLGAIFEPSKLGDCAITRVTNVELYNLNNAWFMYIPVLLVCMTYVIILGKIVHRSRFTRVNQESMGVSEWNMYQRRVRSVVILFISSVWYCGCFFAPPIINAYYPNAWASSVTSLWSRTLVLCGYAANPVLFLILDRDYRDKIRQVWNSGHHSPTTVSAFRLQER